MLERVQRIATESGAILSEKKGVYTFRLVIAERKALLSRKRLEYIAKFRIDDRAGEVRFTDMLKESGAGFSSGVGGDMTPGFGFKRETYKTSLGGREGSIEEQSALFGRRYEYAFDYGVIRREVEAAANTAGYRFSYQITPLGL